MCVHSVRAARGQQRCLARPELEGARWVSPIVFCSEHEHAYQRVQRHVSIRLGTTDKCSRVGEFENPESVNTEA